MAALTEVSFIISHNTRLVANRRPLQAPQQTMILTQSQRHWRAWVSALQTRDASLRAAALEQLSKFLRYWTSELYTPTPLRGVVNGYDTPPPESWDEVFNVDTELLIRPTRPPRTRFNSDEAWVGPYGLDEYILDAHHIQKRPAMNPWDNDDGSKETRETLSRYYCGIQRLVVDCPFADVRRTCRRLLDRARRKRVEIPSLVNDGPSWLIPISEIIGFKTEHHKEHIAINVPEQYVSDESSSDSDFEFRSRPHDYDEATLGYSYYSSPDATPRPTFTTPAIPINAPPRARSRNRNHGITRNGSSDSIAPSTTSSHKPTERKYPRQPRASKEIRDFQISSFITHGRVTNYAKVLFFMPKYLRYSSASYQNLISSPRGLSKSIKTYITLLAAADIGCQYFVSYFAAKFRELGGDNTWLSGIMDTPGKMQRIAQLNRKLFEEPWALTQHDITALTETKELDGDYEEGWNLNEVVQIIIILAMFHAQSSIAMGMGAVCEADVFGGTIWSRISRPADDDMFTRDTEETPSGRRNGVKSDVVGGREDIIEKLRLRMIHRGDPTAEMSYNDFCAFHFELSGKRKEVSPYEGIFREILHANFYDGPTNGEQTLLTFNSTKSPPANGSRTEPDSPVNPIIEDLSRFASDKTTAKSTVFPSDHPILFSSQYSWDNVMQVLLYHLPDVAPSLNKRFHLSPTRAFLQPHIHHSIDVAPFYEALRCYSLALLGIMKETYNYRFINEFLGDELRKFIRTICLDPRSISKSDWEMIKKLGFTSSEIVEISMIVAEARFMGVLTYACRVVGSF